jgi:Arc/MetJ family transcription regulator
MRISIFLDKQLVEEAMQCAGVSTKLELIELALREFVENHKQCDTQSLSTEPVLDTEPEEILTT